MQWKVACGQGLGGPYPLPINTFVVVEGAGAWNTVRMSAPRDTRVECAEGLWVELLAELVCAPADGSDFVAAEPGIPLRATRDRFPLVSSERLQYLMLLDDVRDLAILTAAMAHHEEPRDLKLLTEAKLKIKARLGLPPARPRSAPAGDGGAAADEAEAQETPEMDAALRRAARRVLNVPTLDRTAEDYGITAKSPRTRRTNEESWDADLDDGIADNFGLTTKARSTARGSQRTAGDFGFTAKAPRTPRGSETTAGNFGRGPRRARRILRTRKLIAESGAAGDAADSSTRPARDPALGFAQPPPASPALAGVPGEWGVSGRRQREGWRRSRSRRRRRVTTGRAPRPPPG